MNFYKVVNFVLTHCKVTTVSYCMLPKLKKKIDKEVLPIVKVKNIKDLHTRYI